jgi:hypothetical protein
VWIVTTRPKANKRAADAALREAIGPLLRDLGFAGAFPHWHLAKRDGEAWVVSIQHDKYGGGFRAELGWVPPRALFPALDPRPRVGKGLKAWSVWPTFGESVPTGSFVRYDASLERAVRRVAAALRREVPSWFERNQAVGAQLHAKVTAQALARLEGERTWVRDWLEANAGLPGCKGRLRAKLRRADDNQDRAWIAWKLAAHGDREAHAMLVDLLDDPDVVTRFSSRPGASMRAAQALADIHGVPFRWGSAASIARVRQVVGRRAQ